MTTPSSLLSTSALTPPIGIVLDADDGGVGKTHTAVQFITAGYTACPFSHNDAAHFRSWLQFPPLLEGSGTLHGNASARGKIAGRLTLS